MSQLRTERVFVVNFLKCFFTIQESIFSTMDTENYKLKLPYNDKMGKNKFLFYSTVKKIKDRNVLSNIRLKDLFTRISHLPSPSESFKGDNTHVFFNCLLHHQSYYHQSYYPMLYILSLLSYLIGVSIKVQPVSCRSSLCRTTCLKLTQEIC